MSELILASASPARRALLQAAGVDFGVRVAEIDEPQLMAALKAQGLDGTAIAGALAEAKAVAVSRHQPDAWVLGADSLVWFANKATGKAENLAALKVQLAGLRGQTHELISAACLAYGGTAVWQHVGRARLTMRAFSDSFLEAYLAAEGQSLLGNAGGYRYEGRGAQLFARVAGDHFTILGLPLLPVLAALRARGLLPT